MINFGDIRDVHLEISSLCNASCPWCPRTFWGYPYNGGYPEANLSLAQATQIFQPEFLTQLKSIRINGTEPANPADREDTVKITADVQSVKLKQLLGQIKQS